MLESATPDFQAASAQKPGKPRVWTAFGAAFVTVGAAGLLALAGLVTYSVIDQGLTLATLERLPVRTLVRMMSDELRHPSLFLAIKTIVAAVFGAGALTFGLVGQDPLAERLALRRARVGAVIFASLGLLALGDVLDTLVRLYQLDSYGALLPRLGFITEQLTGSSLASGVLILGPFAGLCEELFFRGYLQSRFVARWGPAAGIFVAALLSAMLELDLVMSTEALLLGLALGWVTWRTASIWPAVFAHGLRTSFTALDSAGFIKLELSSYWRFGAMLVLAMSAFVLLLPDAERPSGHRHA